MVAGHDPQRLAHIRFLANQARREGAGYFHPEIGFNYRMTNLEASLGLAQMERIGEFIEAKRRIHGIYAEAFRDVEEKVRRHGCTWRTGALVLALERVRKANELRGW